MPFTDKDLPAAVQRLPSAAKTLFKQVANRAIERGNSDTAALKIAWAAVKKRFKKNKNGTWVARSSDFTSVTYYTFEAKPAEQFVERSSDGHTLHNYVLTDARPDDAEGTAPTEELLGKWAKWINDMKPEVDTDHALFRQAKEQHGGNISLVSRMLAAKRGIAKAMKAFVDKGRLVVSLLFDKRYESHVDRIKGLSIEAAAEKDERTKRFVGGDLLGFSFMVNETPGNPRAVRIAA